MDKNYKDQNSGRTFKGQAAMEYLMTYGWAILVLVIVIAALYYLLPKTQESCLFQQNFACEGLPQLFVEEDVDGNDQLFVSVKMSNKLGQTATGLELLCTNAGSGDVTSGLFTDAGNAVVVDTAPPGSTFNAVDVPCVNADGDVIYSSEGAGFKGLLAIRYSLETDVDLTKKHTATGTISGTIVK